MTEYVPHIELAHAIVRQTYVDLEFALRKVYSIEIKSIDKEWDEKTTTMYMDNVAQVMKLKKAMRSNWLESLTNVNLEMLIRTAEEEAKIKAMKGRKQ